MTFETLSTILTIENLNSDNHSYLTINCDTGQHLQFLRCYFYHAIDKPIFIRYSGDAVYLSITQNCLTLANSTLYAFEVLGGCTNHQSLFTIIAFPIFSGTPFVKQSFCEVIYLLLSTKELYSRNSSHGTGIGSGSE